MAVSSVTTAAPQTAEGKAAKSEGEDKKERTSQVNQWGKEILDLKTSNARLLEIVEAATKEANDSPWVMNMIEKFIGQRAVKGAAVSNMIQAIMETMKRIANNIGR